MGVLQISAEILDVCINIDIRGLFYIGKLV